MLEISLETTENLSIFLRSDGTILAFNNKAEICYGWNALQIQGKNFFILCDQYKIESPLSNFSIANNSTVITHIKSSIDRTERIIQWCIVQLSERQGNDFYYLLNGLDITQYKANEKKMYNLNEYLSNIIDTVPHFILWKDINSHFLGCNKQCAQSAGLNSPDDIVGKTDFDMPWSSQAEAYMVDDKTIIDNGMGKLDYEEEQTRDDGTKRIMLVSKVPLRDRTNANQISGVLAVYTDITGRKEMEKQLKQAKERAEIANNARSEFIANMSHDIKTPLSGMIGIAEVLSRRLSKEEDIDFAQNIITAGQQLMIFFDNCLEVAKAEGADITLSKEHFNVKTLVQEITDLFYPAIKNKGLTLHVDCEESLPDYWIGSCSGIFRVLMNVVGNAVKFTEKGSITISVKLGSKSAYTKNILKFIVADTGMGIPKEKHKQIFDRFTRLTPSNEGIHSGSGLGLYLVQKLVDAMKGEIHLVSEENKGSQFTIAIPLETPLLAPSEYEANSLVSYRPQKPLLNKKSVIQQASNLTPKNILVIEDNEIAQQIMQAILASLNCQADIANSGKKAIELFKAGKYHHVFLDLGLPDISGYAVASHLRKMEEGITHQVPIIALTAHITDDIIKRCLEAGMNEVLNKPLSIEQAKSIIHH